MIYKGKNIMADFCKDCSIELFGMDFRELANIAREGEAAHVLCEGCGYIWVNSKGEKVDMESKDKMYLRFEYVNEFGYRTILEKKLDGYINSELCTLVYELSNFLKACGFDQQNIEEYIPQDF